MKEQGHAFQRRVQGACACVRASGGGWERLGAPGGQGAALGLARGAPVLAAGQARPRPRASGRAEGEEPGQARLLR